MSVSSKGMLPLVALSLACVLGASACGDDDGGQNNNQVDTLLLTDSHPGWNHHNCASCHDFAVEHPEQPYELRECAPCHGGNGAVVVDESHLGYKIASCNVCHDESVHGGRFDWADCGPCHGLNGGAAVPADHWRTQCNDCHAGGPERWNSVTHAGYEGYDHEGCLTCHTPPLQ